MAKRKSKKDSFYAPGPVVWRITFGRNGPTWNAIKKAWREWTGPREVASVRFDPDKGKAVAKGALRQRRDGTFEFKPAKPKRPTTKQRVANVQGRIAAESDRHAAAQADRAKPMSERVRREGNGRFNGSTKAAPMSSPAERAAAQLARQQSAAYNRAMRSAAASEKRIRRDLGH